jgi:hypothetical protein
MNFNARLAGLILAAFSFSVSAVDNRFDIADNSSSGGSVATAPSNYQFPPAPTATNGILYNNGPLITHPGAGPGGEDVSVLQDNSLGMSTLGFGHQVSAGFRVADDFTISTPFWDIQEITFYAYQTGETASTITAVNLRIWDGPPGQAGSTVVFGDDTTNRMTSTVFANILRATEQTAPAGTNGTPFPTNRQVAASTVAVNIRLPQGTYWLDWQSDGSGTSGPWAPPISILGQTTTGNAMQFVGNWGDMLDGATNTPQGLPFVITGSSIVPQIPATSNRGLLLLVLALGGLALLTLVRRRTPA